MKKILILLVVFLVTIIFIYWHYGIDRKGMMVTYKDILKVTAPRANETVKSSLMVRGEARGNWYFEASFPVRLLDGNNHEISKTVAHAEGEWMTNNFVPFSATLQFETPTTPEGTLVLEKDNPSGLPQNADEFRIPIRFK